MFAKHSFQELVLYPHTKILLLLFFIFFFFFSFHFGQISVSSVVALFDQDLFTKSCFRCKSDIVSLNYD